MREPFSIVFKVNSLTIKLTRLVVNITIPNTVRTIGKNAFKGTPKKATMKVPKKKLKTYKKVMKKKGFKGKVKADTVASKKNK